MGYKSATRFVIRESYIYNAAVHSGRLVEDACGAPEELIKRAGGAIMRRSDFIAAELRFQTRDLIVLNMDVFGFRTLFYSNALRAGA